MKRRLTELILSPSSPRGTARLATASPPSSDTGPPGVKDSLPDDLVPSLPPDWEPPSFSTWEVQSSHSDARDLNEDVSLI